MTTFDQGKLNHAIDQVVGIGEAAGADGLAIVALVLLYVEALEREAPAAALRYRGADVVHVTDTDAVTQRPGDRPGRHIERTADGQALALAHTLRADPNAADRIVCGLDPADLLAFRAATAHLLDLVDTRSRQLVQWRTIGPEAQ